MKAALVRTSLLLAVAALARASLNLQGLCNDRSEHCVAWAAAGECAKNMEHMSKACALRPASAAPPPRAPRFTRRRPRRSLAPRRSAHVRHLHPPLLRPGRAVPRVGPGGRVRQGSRLYARQLPDVVRHLRAAVPRPARGLRLVEGGWPVRRQPRLHAQVVPCRVRRVPLGVQGHAQRLPGLGGGRAVL